MVRILILGFYLDQLTIQPSNPKILGPPATWFLFKPSDQLDCIRIRQYLLGLCHRLFGKASPAASSVIF